MRRRPISSPDKAVDNWHKEESGYGRKEQAADNRATQRRVLLAALTQAQRHRHHADDHGKCGHDDWAESSGASFENRLLGGQSL